MEKVTTNPKEKAKSKNNFTFNPFEIFIEGKESLKKSIFCKDIVENLSKRINLAYISYSSDSSKITIKNKKNKVSIENKVIDLVLEKSVALNYDFVLINTRQKVKSKKIVFLESYYNVQEGLDDIILFTGEERYYSVLNTSIPFIDDDYIEEVASYLTSAYNPPEIYGLVLTGGKSSRMGQDKAFLDFNGKQQYQYTYDLMSQFFSKVFISCKEEQKDLYNAEIEKIYDIYNDVGPMAGILSAMNKYPDKAWFVMACDLPSVNENAINNLLEQRNYMKYATAYISSSDKLPEPLCTIYEPKSKIRMMQLLGLGYSCPRKFLINSEINLIEQKDKRYLTNINNYDEYQEYLKNNDK